MSRTSFFKIALSLFLFSVLFAGTVSAQTNSCAVKMEVYRYNTDTLINGAAATAVNSDTKKSYKSVLSGGQPSFTKLPEGNYRVYVTKAKYFRSADDFTLDCSENNEEFPWTVDLYKGSPKLTVKLYKIVNAVDDSVIQTIKMVRGDGNTIIGAGEPNAEAPPLPPTGAPTKTVPKMIMGGVVNGKATKLVKPPYPAAARAVRAGGAVQVQVTIGEDGNVLSAIAISGHPLLRQAAVDAAKASTFSPTLLSGQPVKVTGVIVYNFVP